MLRFYHRDHDFSSVKRRSIVKPASHIPRARIELTGTADGPGDTDWCSVGLGAPSGRKNQTILHAIFHRHDWKLVGFFAFIISSLQYYFFESYHTYQFVLHGGVKEDFQHSSLRWKIPKRSEALSELFPKTALAGTWQWQDCDCTMRSAHDSRRPGALWDFDNHSFYDESFEDEQS